MAYNDIQRVYTNRALPGESDSSNVTFWIVPLGGIANVNAPTAAEINAGLNITDAVRIDGFDFGPQESDQSADRSFGDNATASYRSFSQFGGSVPFYEPKPTDTTSIARQVKTLVSPQDATFYWVERIADGKVKSDAAASGDYVSVFKVMTGSKQYDTSDRGNGITYSRSLLPQGDVAINAMVATAITPTYAPTTLAQAVGDVDPVKATLASRDITRGGTWVSSAPAVATVSANGVVTAVSAGTATITKVHPAASGAGTGVAVTVS